ncbi:MAG: hypothetical protein ABI679_13940 [Gemmatimonadota bacterium]
MRSRIEILLSLAVLLVLGILAAAAGASKNRVPSQDPRRSTFLSGPFGAKAYADALTILHVRIDHYRQRTAALPTLKPGATRPILALLDPLNPIDGTQAADLLRFLDKQGDLLLAGNGTSAAMRCFGFDVDWRGGDSTPVYRVENGVVDPAPVSWTADGVLAALALNVIRDSSDMSAGAMPECTVRRGIRIDTLLVTAGGRLAAARLEFDSGRSVTLVADGVIFSNLRLKESEAGLVTLRMIAGKYSRAMFDEFEHGYGPSGSLLGATIGWSLKSPLGWAAWQLAFVSLLALLASAIRFGVSRSVIDRRRRSPLEHVRALATALAAARGNHVAVDLMVRGLRRRLSPVGTPSRGDPRPWLETLSLNVRSEQSRQAVTTLLNLIRRAPVSDSVLRAANAVEDVWQDLKPPPSR